MGVHTHGGRRLAHHITLLPGSRVRLWLWEHACGRVLLSWLEFWSGRNILRNMEYTLVVCKLTNTTIERKQGEPMRSPKGAFCDKARAHH